MKIRIRPSDQKRTGENSRRRLTWMQLKLFDLPESDPDMFRGDVGSRVERSRQKNRPE